ncbi:hypothetical protein VTO73DRAFT_7849 [Trametes versicolor]
MNVSFPSFSPKNTPVINSATGEHLFQLSTPIGFRSRSTTLWDAQDRMVGKYKTGWAHDELTYHGQTMTLAEWLVERSGSCGRTFLASNGRSYEWQWEILGSGGYKLIDCLTDKLIARGHRKHTRPSRKMSIDVLPEGYPFLDAIVLSFVLCERIREEQETAALRRSRASMMHQRQQLQAMMATQQSQAMMATQQSQVIMAQTLNIATQAWAAPPPPRS